MRQRSRPSDWVWVGGLLHPIAATAIGATVAIIGTAAVIYPLALHDWGNVARNLAAVEQFYEEPDIVASRDDLVEGTVSQRPSEYLRVTVKTLVFNAADPAADCLDRVHAALHPDHAGGTAPDGDIAEIEDFCLHRWATTGSFGRPGMLVAAIPVFDVAGALVGARIQSTVQTAAPSLFDAVLERRALSALAVVTALSGIVGLLMGLLARAHLQRLRRVAMIDGLTGCLRREAFLDAADRALRDARRHRRPLSMLVMDVDRLKQINDRFGHAGGDAALSLVASSMRSALRAGDVLGRIGGDEFAAVLPAANLAEAAAIAERARAGIGVMHLALGGEQTALSVSIGLAELERGEDAATLIKRADQMAYGAKTTRNAVRS